MQFVTKLVGTAQHSRKYLPSKRAYFTTCYTLKNLNTLGYIHHCSTQNHTQYCPISSSFKHLLNNEVWLWRSCKPSL